MKDKAAAERGAKDAPPAGKPKAAKESRQAAHRENSPVAPKDAPEHGSSDGREFGRDG